MAKEKIKEPSILTPQELKPILKQIGARIRDLRKKKGYSSYAIFAMDHNINYSWFGQVERGHANLTMINFINILAALDVSFEDFFQGFKKK